MHARLTRWTTAASCVVAVLGVVPGTAASAPEAGPVVVVNDVTVVEGTGGARSAQFVLSIGSLAGAGKKVTVATANGSATSPKDYTAVPATVLTFNATSGLASISVPIVTDSAAEASETFQLLLSQPVGVTISDPVGVATITDDDKRTISIADATVVEGDSGTTNLTFTLSLNKPALAAATVNVSTADGTAKAPTDFTALTNAPVNFAAGATSATATVLVKGDVAIEPNEAFTLNLGSQTTFIVGDGSATGSITSDDSSGSSISIGDAIRAETDAGQVALSFPITLTGALTSPTSITVTTANGTATGGSDFVGPSALNVNIPANTTSAAVNVILIGDTVVEPTETFTVTITNPSVFQPGDTTATGTIVDNDAVPVVSVADVTVTEGDSGTSNVEVTVSLDRPAPAARNLTFRTVDASATSPSDFTAKIGALVSMPAFASSAMLTVAIKGDTTAEGTETFDVTLLDLGGFAAGDTTATVTISDNDGTPNTISVSDVTITEGTGAGATQAIITVSFGQPTTGSELFRVKTADGTAVAASDYNAINVATTVQAGLTQKTFPVFITRDAIDENDEQFTVLVSDLVGFVAGDTSATVTITDDDGAVAVASIADVSVTEGNSGTTTATLTVSLNAPAAGPVRVDVTTSSGTATSGSDFQALAGTVDFAVGDTSKQVQVLVNGDAVVEGDEAFTVQLSNPQGATIADGTATVTILDDDSAGGLRITSISNPTIVEGNSGTKALNFTVFLSGPATGTETFVISTANGTATAGSDYVARTNATITVPAGNTQRNVTITINGDTTVEAAETLFLNIVSAIGLLIDDTQAIGTINNDD